MKTRSNMIWYGEILMKTRSNRIWHGEIPIEKDIHPYYETSTLHVILEASSGRPQVTKNRRYERS
jgi:hypothetical protein